MLRFVEAGMKNTREEILWKGKWAPADGHLINIKKCLDAAVKRGSGASADILHGERGLEFYFGVNAKKVLHYFMDMDRDKAVKAIGGLIKYQGRLMSDSGDLAALASTLNKQKFLPSDEFIQWVNSD
jgi:hypothetical protein